MPQPTIEHHDHHPGHGDCPHHPADLGGLHILLMIAVLFGTIAMIIKNKSI